MKNQFLLSLALLLCACTSTQQTENQTNAAVADTALTEKSIEPDATPTQRVVHQLIGQQNQLKAKLKSATPEAANQLYEASQEETYALLNQLDSLEENVLVKYVEYYDQKTEKIVLPDSVKPTQQLLDKAGLEFWEIGEGMTEIRPKPRYFLEIFENYVTPDYREFLKINAKEDEKLYSADAGLVISFEELGDRILTWENFLRQYPNSKLMEKAKTIYKSYQHTYLIGMVNTPVVDEQTGKIYPESLAEFKRFSEKHPDSPTTHLIKLVQAHQGSFDALLKVIENEQNKL